eukprot:gb/GEZN01004664.1/.p1 GENE.gb/GEZN01004664.1/~~gb/GEZN01004664.1/.p1  ORF type:complete len:302 (-),score=-2.63 gb/GEZN01004664.1/:687-1592(-)
MKGQERIELTSISGTYQMRSMPAADFPDLPLIVSGIPVRLEAEALIRGLRGTIFATSNDEAKQVLTGVHLCFTNHELECAATDGHRLAVLRLANAVTEDLLIKAEEIKETEEEDGIEDFAVTLPARSLKELERLLSGHPTKEAVSLFYNRGQAVFLWANQILTSRTLDGIYPAYKGLIPDHFTRSIALERKALISALERVAVLAGQHNNVVRLEGDPMTRQLCISADAQEIGSGSEEMLAIITGGCIEIAFNVRYMLDGLKAMTDERIEILCNSSNTPAILTPQGDMHSFMYLIMPIQVRD